MHQLELFGAGILAFKLLALAVASSLSGTGYMGVSEQGPAEKPKLDDCKYQDRFSEEKPDLEPGAD